MNRHAVVLALLLVGFESLAAQETTGAIRGRLVADPIGGLSDAVITATSPDLIGERRTVSRGDGVYTLLALPPGTYTLRVAAIGYRPVVIEQVTVQLGRVSGLGDLAMEPAAVALAEITITAPQVTLDPVHTTMGATLEASELAVLPADRDYKSLIAIVPHVNKSTRGDPANAAGATGLENQYFVDGVNVTAALKAQSGTSLPYNFVRAIEVRTGGYEAQYGKALGAVVNAVTYSGTNDVAVSVFGFLTHSTLTATPRGLATLREAGALSYDVGVRLGGPVLRDRLWYSAAYNPRVERSDYEIAGHGLFAADRTAHSFAGKLTWHAHASTQVELSLFGDPSVRRAVTVPLDAPGYTPLDPDPYLTRLTTGGVVGSLRASTRLGERLLLEAALSQATERDNMEPTTEIGRNEPNFIDDVARTISGGVRFPYTSTLQRSAAALRATVTAGSHTAIVGMEYEDASASTASFLPGGFNLRRDESGFVALDERFANGGFHNRVPTAFLQDSWRVTERLTLNAGVRWSSQTLTGASGDVAQRFGAEWQPRLGVIWQPGQRRHRVFGSIGRYYQQIPLYLSSQWFVDYILVISSYATDPRQGGVTPDRVEDYSTPETAYTKNTPGLAVENSDEFTLGYERLVGSSTLLTVRIVRRELRSSFQSGFDPSTPPYGFLGNPGKGDLAFLPKPVREYTAVELGAAGLWWGIAYRASYVLSRNWGNRTGLHMSDLGFAGPGTQNTFSTPFHAVNSTGLLPNDRTHVFKLSASRRFGFGLQSGLAFSWASGSPLNVFAPGRFAFPAYEFAVPRGSAGRTTPLWDLDLRLAHEFRWKRGATARVLLDVLHLGNPQRATWLDEVAYLRNDDGTFADPNPAYGTPVAFQPPMTARVGLEVRF